MRGYLSCIVFLVEGSRRKIAQTCLLANAVIEDLDVFNDFTLSLFAGGETRVVHQFGFQGAPKLSIGALSQQFPLRLMEACMPNCRSSFW